MYCEHWKCVNRRLPCCRGMVARLRSCNGDVRRSNSVGSRFCVFSHLVCIPVVFVSPLHWCRAHTHPYISLSRTCVLICPTTVICLCFTRVGPLVSCKSCVFPFHLDIIAGLLTDLETRRFGIFLFHIGSGAEILGDVRCN